VDGNGGTVRLGVTTVIGSSTRSCLASAPCRQVPGADGVRPTWLGFGVNPPFRPDATCSQQALPNLSARSGPARPGRGVADGRPKARTYARFVVVFA